MAKFGIGQPVRRVEDQRFLTGQGRYVDDIVLPGMAHGCNVLSPHAHAKIKKIDVSKAKAAPGVLLVLTGADAVADKIGALTSHLMPEDFGAPKGHRTFQPLLVADRVRHVGDRVAFVVAETLAQARDAAELVEVDYEPLPALVNIEDAAKPDALEGLGRQPARQQRLPPDVRQQGRDRRGFRQGQARRQAPRREQPAVAGFDGAARRHRRLQRRDRRDHALRRLRRIRTARAWSSRTSSMCRRTASAWCRPTSAAASASRAASSPRTAWWSGPRASCAGR